MKAVFLIGFMGVGKSYLGRQLAQQLNVPFTDSDSELEQKTGVNIPHYFKTKGQDAFRQLETNWLLNSNHYGVVSCGGGIISTPAAKFFLQNACTIWLDADFMTLKMRWQGTTRPLVKGLTTEQLQQLYNSRRLLYRQAASYYLVNPNLCGLESLVNYALKV